MLKSVTFSGMYVLYNVILYSACPLTYIVMVYDVCRLKLCSTTLFTGNICNKNIRISD
jgi:hypothetical protein